MTNYRFYICGCVTPEFKYCFTCGALLKMDGSSLVCSKSWVHCRFFIEECSHDDNCDHEIRVE